MSSSEYASWDAMTVKEHGTHGIIFMELGASYVMVSDKANLNLISKIEMVLGLNQMVGVDTKEYDDEVCYTFNKVHLLKNLTVLINAKYCVYQVDKNDSDSVYTLIKVHTPGTFDSTNDINICCIHIHTSLFNVSVVDTSIGNLGVASVNGDYAPHLHFQIIRDLEDNFGDYPGVASENNIPFYKRNCPDPNLLLKLK